jgi:hypothetical protein
MRLQDNRSVEDRLSFIAFGDPQAKAGLSPAVARLGMLKAYPHIRKAGDFVG